MFFKLIYPFHAKKHKLPNDALLARYCPEVFSSSRTGYCDCYAVTVNGVIELEEFVYHFYSTPIFKLERWILRIAVNHPSTDQQIKQLAIGKADKFAAWIVEERRVNQLLLRDVSGRTRSWFMRYEFHENKTTNTLLLFGSAVLPVTDRNTRNQKLGVLFTTLMVFHKLYSRLLLASASKKIAKQRRRI